SIKQFSFNWNLLLLTTGLAIIGVIAGTYFSKKIDNKLLKKIFAGFVIAMAVFILVKELFFS
ncbi:MAG: TSUP family transporter, partial [Lacibacter sp.]